MNAPPLQDAFSEAARRLAHGERADVIEHDLIARGYDPKEAAMATEDWFERRYRLVNQEIEQVTNRQWRDGLILLTIGVLAVLIGVIVHDHANRIWAQPIIYMLGFVVFWTVGSGIRLVVASIRQRPLHEDDEFAKRILSRN
ncbi:hypothetical protein BH11PLA2_BH11PLA2_19390 [soil metagenome]